MNTNPQIYKTVGSLIFHKYEQLHSTSFRCKEIVKHQDTDYAFFSSITNNNRLSQLSTISISNDNMCLMIDNKSCYSNRLYYHSIVRHIFINRGTFYANDVLLYFFTFLIGAIITIIRRPSILGKASAAPISASSLMNFNNRSCPLSLKTIVRPLKCT